MCNNYRVRVEAGTIIDDCANLRVPLRFPEGVPNFAPRDVRITDIAPIIRWDGETGALVQRRWSWPGPTGKPVYNFRSDGRALERGRCLIVADAFYEFTDASGRKRKDKWRFAKAGEAWFGIAGLWRESAVGEAFTMLTTAPGPDVAPYHARQVAVLERTDWRAWLDGSAAAADVIGPLPAGRLTVERVE